MSLFVVEAANAAFRSRIRSNRDFRVLLFAFVDPTFCLSAPVLVVLWRVVCGGGGGGVLKWDVLSIPVSQSQSGPVWMKITPSAMMMVVDVLWWVSSSSASVRHLEPEMMMPKVRSLFHAADAILQSCSNFASLLPSGERTCHISYHKQSIACPSLCHRSARAPASWYQ